MTEPCPAEQSVLQEEEVLLTEAEIRAMMKAEMLDHLSRMVSWVEAGELTWFAYVGALVKGPAVGSAGGCAPMVQVGLATLLKEEVTGQVLRQCQFRLVNEEERS